MVPVICNMDQSFDTCMYAAADANFMNWTIIKFTIANASFYHDMQISWPDSGSPPIRLLDS